MDKPRFPTTCNECGGEVRKVQIACPVGRPGCLVAHYQDRCIKCGTRFRPSPDPLAEKATGREGGR